jgi:hypothetical protein
MMFSTQYIPRCYRQEKFRVQLVGGTEAENIVGIRNQETTGKETADWENLLRDVMNCRVWIIASSVVTICKCSIIPIANPDPVY